MSDPMEDFDLDELDGPDFELDGGGVAAAECDEAPAAEAATPPFEQHVDKRLAGHRRSRRPAATRHAPSGNSLYLDLETIPDLSRYAAFRLDPIPQAKNRAPVEACPPVAAVLEGTLEQIAATIKQLNPCHDWLTALVAAEAASKKPRAGVSKLVAEATAADTTLVAAIDERRKLLSVTPEYCKIAALGWAVGDNEPQSLVLGVDVQTEAEILDVAWGLIAKCRPVVGFNCLHFDLPTLFVRSALLKVPSSRMLDMRPWGGDVIDLAKARFPAQTPKGMGLKALLRLYGIPCDAGEMDGSQVAELMVSDPAMVGTYVRSDVKGSRDLRRFYAGYFCP